MTPEEAEARARHIWVTLDEAECEDWIDLGRALGSDPADLYAECVRLCHDHHIGQADPKYLTERFAFWRRHKIRPTMTQSEINHAMAAWTARNMPR